jgi:cytochrome d ubiquinol oxidase subunit II
MELTTVWFLLIATLWIGYFVLEGFDFGVGILLRVLGRDEPERRAVITTIGPVWDGNEVWLIVAGGATFAAFPEWYATLFSGFYLPLFAILVTLILRGVALEYRGKRDDLPWRSRMDTLITIGSLVPAFLWGITFANLVRGVPIAANHEFVGGLGDLVSPFALLGGVAFTVLFVAHGAIFLALKTTDELRQRANRLASVCGLAAVALAVGFLGWAHGLRGDAASIAVAAAAAVALFAGLVGLRRDHLGDRAGCGVVVRGVVPGGDAVDAQRGMESDRHQRRLDAVHVEDHDGGCCDLHAAGHALPGLDLLGVPAADHS